LLAISATAAAILPAHRPVTVQITTVPFDEPELVNPGRGYYDWRGHAIIPLPEPSHDDYERFFWYDADRPEESIEPVKGVYNFDMLDRAIAAADARGQKFAFRIRTMANKMSGKRFVPDYLAECGWEYRNTFIPDWNSECFLDSAEKLMQALGERYNGDPRIAWMDIGLYGEWGEWALSEDTFQSAPDGISSPSEKSLARIIDIQVDAFPDTRKVMFAKTRSDAVVHALKRSDQIGWRVDCFARNGYFSFDTHEDHAPAWKYMKDRWKTAPVIVEFCNGNVSLSNSTPLDQVQDFHIALIGNGNIPKWNWLNSQAQENLVLAGKLSGYRYQIRSITTPPVWEPGLEVSVETNWENVGVAPHYEHTEVIFKLYDPRHSRYIWEAKSKVNLQMLLPTGDRPFSMQDELRLSASIPPGIYPLHVVVVDPEGYRRPLKLAISGQQKDGSYVLGSVIVQAPTRRR
jgi:hypothetical protein